MNLRKETANELNNTPSPLGEFSVFTKLLGNCVFFGMSLHVFVQEVDCVFLPSREACSTKLTILACHRMQYDLEVPAQRNCGIDVVPK